MRTIAVVSQKGGAGKTTLAVHLATEAARSHVALIVDTDPQATASRWGEWRRGAEPEVIDCGAPSLLAGKLAKAADLGAELAVIDTPPHADAMARQASRLADLILIPCRPRAFDLAAIEATAELVRSSGKPAFVVFNAGPPRAPLIYREATSLIGDAFRLPIAPVVLPERAAFHHSAAAGRTAPEHQVEGKAAGEIRALWAWTCAQLDVPPPRRTALVGAAA
ncbi:MAG: AAA family ATPase [Phenylobacterium sp.]|uniref:AAA family ATPase n=1 Tax=Phenylobacterium sp. TaxID=1871053 RepID=UPI0025E574E6|nr:AAA family ATPase [Phenylobacterium sp.]MBI1198298.1 AAA family ATPase [Phenylobacterium sp.]